MKTEDMEEKTCMYFKDVAQHYYNFSIHGKIQTQA